MEHIEVTRELAASQEALWATVSDLANLGEWFTAHQKRLDAPPTTLREGTELTAGNGDDGPWLIDNIAAGLPAITGSR
jgi:uncharacterized protein YndB with AHSA1/START domain